MKCLNCNEEIKEIWDGPENIISEILDAKAAICALLNISIFEQPELCESLQRYRETGRSVGLL